MHCFHDLKPESRREFICIKHHKYRRHIVIMIQINQKEDPNLLVYLIPQSHQTRSHYILQNGLKLCVNYLNVVQTN